jgi:hypothetical protein
VFLINVPADVVALLRARASLGESRSAEGGTPPDVTGIGMPIAGVALVGRLGASLEVFRVLYSLLAGCVTTGAPEGRAGTGCGAGTSGPAAAPRGSAALDASEVMPDAAARGAGGVHRTGSSAVPGDPGRQCAVVGEIPGTLRGRHLRADEDVRGEGGDRDAARRSAPELGQEPPHASVRERTDRAQTKAYNRPVAGIAAMPLCRWEKS